MQDVRQMMLVDPSELLPEHHALLHTDFTQLGSGTTAGRIQWIEQVEGAIWAKRAVLSGKGRPSAKDFSQRGYRTDEVGIPVEQQSNLSTTEKRMHRQPF